MGYYLLNLYAGRIAVAALLDALAFLSAAAIAWVMLAPPFPLPAYALAAGIGTLGSLVALFYCDGYRLTAIRSSRATLGCVVGMMGLAFALALVVYFAVQVPEGTTAALAHVAGAYFPLLIGERFIYRAVISLPRFGHRVLVIGTSDLGRAIAQAVRERGQLGFELAGFLSDGVEDQGAEIEGYPVLGKVHQVDKFVEEGGVDWVVVASKNRDEHFPQEALLEAKLKGRHIVSGVSFYERVTGRVYLRDLRPSYLIFSDGFRMSRFAELVKRSIDIAVSATGLLLASPLLALAAAAIKLDRGPVFYAQERVGKDNRHFSVLKLRSMRQDAERETGPVWSQRKDSRITLVGSLLRKTRLDEIPQLWNVLVGDMSLVGPRPERPEFVDTLAERYPYFRARAALKPGVTGWAQIRHGYVNEVEGFEEKLALDFYYMKYRSIGMDLLILWRTARTVVLFRGV
jgi:exopolysaccharide biosynthesis polyprenyl glycosylphosphotransferase